MTFKSDLGYYILRWGVWGRSELSRGLIIPYKVRVFYRLPPVLNFKKQKKLSHWTEWLPRCSYWLLCYLYLVIINRSQLKYLICFCPLLTNIQILQVHSHFAFIFILLAKCWNWWKIQIIAWKKYTSVFYS